MTQLLRHVPLTWKKKNSRAPGITQWGLFQLRHEKAGRTRGVQRVRVLVTAKQKFTAGKGLRRKEDRGLIFFGVGETTSTTNTLGGSGNRRESGGRGTRGEKLSPIPFKTLHRIRRILAGGYGHLIGGGYQRN